MIISATPRSVNASQEELFEFLSDFNNYEQLMPDQIVNWRSDTDGCSFTISGMLSLALKFKEKTPHDKIDIIPDGKSPIHFTLKINLEEENQDRTTAKVEVDADLNPMMAMMAKRPLENLVQMISEKLEKKFEA